MNEKLKYFTYSQNSLNTYKSCPFKFKHKYIDNINWKYDDVDSREYYDSLKLGREFHLLCERYFSQIPLGNCQNKEFNKWINKIKDLFPIKDENIYSLKLCTHCEKESKLFSYRASNGTYGRLFSFIYIK